jgi:hypothetical protein
MTLLEFFLVISWVIILFIALDITNRRKFNLLHFFVFFSIWWALLVFTIFPNVLDKVWKVFWVTRWADVLVYSSIIFLFYFVLWLLKRQIEGQEDLTTFLREFAIENSPKRKLNWKEAFVIPVYNEKDVVLDTINSIQKKWYKNIIIINDGSNDWTKELLKSLWDSVIVLHHMKNRGQWAALETGFEYVRRYWDVEFVVTFDSDWQHNINDLETFYKIADEKKDVNVFLGSRFLKNSSNVPFSRKIILKLGILFTYLISSLKLTDTHNWYRVIKAKELDKIKITQDWMSHSSEIIDIIATKKIKFVEVPVNIKYTEYSIKKWQKSMNAIDIAMETIWNKFFK